ncbi:hypothetical protein IMX26_16695 [Clostridium sp. 'deep sea']|uniref:phosphatidylinositol-specific phospholipase C domain-containing protein n=1 Tax=Clostridium sp. 'deep sea' TaxID=2779445 RepID=UPI0018963F80|nr:phosphatidylinositol-specific phospholipase C domain-containing protein [Clostridium sp. 'deep sea']QOR35073.1 hypothetical protein IMX26_16695 [Clostridium sp. 'deep sea']
MTFRIGRHGSDRVANWFKRRIPANQTTFNHNPGKLNFGFMGTLKLTITGGILGKGKDTFTFKNIGIAQGHAGASNNWWFGGQNCSYIGNHRVLGSGINSKKIPVQFVFLRGGNSVNKIEVTPQTLIDLKSWMGRLGKDTKLEEVIMPGSHDAGMSETHHCNPPILADPYTKTQNEPIGSQLVNGSRYFDIRVDYDHDELVTYHREGKYGCNGQDLKNVFDEVTAFLNAHNTETVIFKVSHIRGDSGHNKSETKEKIDKFLNSYSSVFYTYKDNNNDNNNDNKKVNLAKLTLSELRGKLILVFDYSKPIDESTGRFRYEDGMKTKSNANLTVYDSYSNTNSYSKMKDDQLAKFKEWTKIPSKDTGLFLLSWTLTAKPGGSYILELAKQANSKLPDVLYDVISSSSKKPNIVYIDGLNSVSAQSIVLHNF